MEQRLGHLAAVTVCVLVYLSVDSVAATNVTTTLAPDNNSTGGNVTNATDLTTAPTTFAATDSVAPTDAPTDATPTMAPTDAPPTPVPPTPVPPTPVPTGGSWTDAPSTMAPVLTTDAPTTTPVPTTTAAPPVCDASPFYCGSAVPPQASCLLRTQAYIASLSCRCTAETTRLPVVSIGASSQSFTLLFTSDLRLTATVYHAWCPSGADPTWNSATITWSIWTPAGIKVSPVGAVLSGPSLFVPAGRLPIGTVYTVTVSAVVSKSTITVVGTGNVSVSSVAPAPQVSIIGGNRIVPANDQLRIALDITDVFLQSNAVKWSCCQVSDAQSTTCLQFCQPPLDALSLFTSATLSLSPPGGSFAVGMLRISATYANIVDSISVQIVNATVPQPIIFVPQAGFRRPDAPITIGVTWTAVPYATTWQWLINGSAPGRNVATPSADGSSLTILAGAYNPGTILAMSFVMMQGTATVGLTSDSFQIESVPTTGNCVVSSTDAQPIGGSSTLQVNVAGWQATSNYPSLSLRVGFIDNSGTTQIISTTESPIDSTGRASTTFVAPLVASFITAQQRSASLTFVAQIIDSDRKFLVGRTTCSATVYSFALTSGLPDVTNSIVASLGTTATTAVVLPKARDLAVIAASMLNATQVSLVNIALKSLSDSLAQSPVNSLSNSVRLGTLRLSQSVLTSFSSPSTVLTQSASGSSAQSSGGWFHTLVRLFRAEAAPTAGPLLPNSTATLFSSLVATFVPTSTSTAQVDISAMLSSDADAATTLMTCATAIPFAAVDSASTWRGFATLLSVATTAAPSTVTPYQIATWRDGTASAIVATRAYVYNALPSLTVMSTTFVPSTAAANSVLTVSSSMVQLRMSATAVNVTLTTNQGMTLRNQLAMPGIVNSASGSYYIVSDTVFALNMTTDDDSLTPLQAARGTLGSISFDQISSVIQTASAKRPDIAANQTVLLQQVQCQQIRGDGTLLAISTLVTATSVSCNAVSPNALYALWIFRPSSLDIVDAVSTTAAPTTSAPIATIIQVQGSSDNAMQSLIIVLSTLGALLLIGLAGVGVLLYLKIRGQAAKDPDAGGNNKRLLEFHEVNNRSTLLEVAAPRALSNMDEMNSSPSRGNTFRGRDPSVHSSSMLRSPERAFSPIKSVDGDEDMSVAAPPSESFATPSFAVPSPLPPRVFIDAELQFVPKRRPGAVVAPENDPTPWL